MVNENMLQYLDARRGSYEKDVQAGIERHRKGDAKLLIRHNGQPVEGVLRIKQKTHEFKFGCNCFMLDEMETDEKNENYKRLFADVFNLATLPFYWDTLEPEEGKPRYHKDSPRIYRRPTPDLCLEYCRQYGIEPKAHCLNYMKFTPDWVPDDIDRTKYLLEKRFCELSELYAEQIPCWEVINETLCWNSKRSFYYDPQIVEWSFEMAQTYFPHNELTINEYTKWWLGPYHGNRAPYYMQIERALARGTRIDSIGLQYHLFGKEDFSRINQYYLDPVNLMRHLNLYGEHQRPLQMTEVTIPAYSDLPEDEERQAQLLETLYSIWFSHENMDKIVYWNLVDGYAAFAPLGDMAAGENWYYGGLLRFDGTPKPAFHRLKHLIGSLWHTEAEIPCHNGQASFRGFYGEYDVEIELDGKLCSTELKLSKKSENQFVLNL